MTNAQKWIAAFLFLFIVLFGISRFTDSEEENYDEMESYVEEQAYGTDDVKAVMDELGCFSCHGENLKGTELGPSLIGVGKYWNRSELINYFRNPSSYRGDSRFDEYRKIYQMDMTSFNEVDVKTLGQIADFVMKLK